MPNSIKKTNVNKKRTGKKILTDKMLNTLLNSKKN